MGSSAFIPASHAHGQPPHHACRGGGKACLVADGVRHHGVADARDAGARARVAGQQVDVAQAVQLRCGQSGKGQSGTADQGCLNRSRRVAAAATSTVGPAD